MKNIHLLLYILGILHLSSVHIDAQLPIDPLLDSLQQELADARGVGAMISIVTSDSILYVGGIGFSDKKAEIPVSQHHLFRLGSISKSFTAIALIKLLRDNGYDLDTPILTILPDIPIDNPWSATHPITVAHVLEHTAGFDDLHMYAWDLQDTIPPSAYAQVDLAKKSLYVRWQPGTRFSYSNPGYLVAGLLIEHLSGQPYNDYIDEFLLSPLGMDASQFYYLPPPASLPMSTGYHNEGGVFSPIKYRSVNAGAAGDLCSNAAEMAHFLQFLMNKGKDTVSILTKADFDRIEMPKNTLGVDHGLTGGYGLGNGNDWRNGYAFHGHNGGIPGFSSNYVYSRDADIGVAVSVNANGFPDHLIDVILDYYIPVDSSAVYHESRTPISDETIAKYSGFYHYKNPRQQLLAFVTDMVEGRRLVITTDSIATYDFWGSPYSTYFHDTDNRFFRKGEGINSFALFENEGTEVFWQRSSYAAKSSLFWTWVEFVFIILSAVISFLFFFYGIIQAFINLASDTKRFIPSFSSLWAASFAFVVGVFSFIFSNVITHKTEPSFVTITFMIATVAFLILSISALIIYFKKRPSSTAAKMAYGCAACLMTALSIYLWCNGIVGLTLWNY